VGTYCAHFRTFSLCLTKFLEVHNMVAFYSRYPHWPASLDQTLSYSRLAKYKNSGEKWGQWHDIQAGCSCPEKKWRGSNRRHLSRNIQGCVHFIAPYFAIDITAERSFCVCGCHGPWREGNLIGEKVNKTTIPWKYIGKKVNYIHTVQNSKYP